MKLNYLQFETQLKKQLAGIYLISGEDVFLKQEALLAIRKAAKKLDFNERTRLNAESGLDEEHLYSLFYSGFLFNEKRILEIDFRDKLPNKALAKLLQEYAENLKSDILVIISTGKLDDKTTKSAWYKNVDKNGVTLPIWPITREQLAPWITARARKYSLQINHDAANLLADYVEGNLIAAAQALEKIYLLKPQAAIDSELIKTVLTNESHFTVFDFTDSLIAGDTPRTLRILNTLKEENIEPSLILWSITRELRMLAGIASQAELGISYEQSFQKQRIFSRRQTSLLRFLKNTPASDCWHYLTEAAEIDKIIKGVSIGNVWDRLQLFCLRLAH